MTSTIPPIQRYQRTMICHKYITTIYNNSVRNTTYPPKLKITPATKEIICPSVFFLQYLKYLRKNYVLKSTITSLNNYLLIYADSTAYNMLHSHLKIARNPLIKTDCVVLLFTDPSKSIDCLNHNLCIAQLQACVFDHLSLKYIMSYLKGRFQRSKVGTSFTSGNNIFPRSHRDLYWAHSYSIYTLMI